MNPLKQARLPDSVLGAVSSSGRVSTRRALPMIGRGLPDDRHECKRRRCLSCGHPFESLGAWNRICRSCINQVNKNIDETL